MLAGCGDGRNVWGGGGGTTSNEGERRGLSWGEGEASIGQWELVWGVCLDRS